MADKLLNFYKKNKSALKHYTEFKASYEMGIVSDEQWSEFCELCLDELLAEQSKVLEKLSKKS